MTKTIKEAAYEYLDKGMVVIPIKQHDKAPAIAAWQKRTLEDVCIEQDFPEGAGRNMGVLLGSVSGGTVDIDLDCEEAVRIAPLLLPETKMIFGREGSPRSHYIYRVPDCHERHGFSGPNTEGMLVEYRGNGGQTVFPPSIHPTGQSIRFDCDGVPATIAHDELIESVKKVAAAALLAKHWAKGRRHDTAMALSGALLSRGWAAEDAKAFIEAVCKGAADHEVKDRLTAVSTTEKAQERDEPTTGFTRLQEILGDQVADKVAGWLDLDFHHGGIGHNSAGRRDEALRYTDIGNAGKFVECHGDKLRYCYEWGTWLSWNGKQWVIGDKASVERMAEDTIRSFEEEAERISDNRDRDTFLTWTKRSGNRSHIKAMCEQARHRVHIDQGKLDADIHAINADGMIIDLRTGEARRSRHDDYCTNSIGAIYEPGAECPQFKAFLDRIMDGSDDLKAYLQRAVGYSLTGDIKEQCFFIAHGSGANGKSVFLSLIRKMIGDYGRNVSMTTLMATKTGGSVSNDIARLRGARFVTASEGEAHQRLKESFIKELTGGEQVTARFLFQEHFEFIPQLKLWMATNHKPKVSGDDPAIWRRIHLIPFKVVIPPDEQDGDLPRKLEGEMSGVLNWAIHGAVDWYRYGLMPPKEVLSATEAYRTEMDIFSRFLGEGIIIKREGRISKAILYTAYCRWASDEGGEPLSKTEFGKRMKRRGYEDGKSKSGRYWKDIEIDDGGVFSL